jgi:hypothetical protein
MSIGYKSVLTGVLTGDEYRVEECAQRGLTGHE